jgi:hypothetical protein
VVNVRGLEGVLKFYELKAQKKPPKSPEGGVVFGYFFTKLGKGEGAKARTGE